MFKLILLLLDKYQPDGIIGMVEQLDKLMKLKLDDGKSLKKLGGHITRIINKYQTKLDKGQKVAIIHKCDQKQYADIIIQ